MRALFHSVYIPDIWIQDSNKLERMSGNTSVCPPFDEVLKILRSEYATLNTHIKVTDSLFKDNPL